MDRHPENLAALTDEQWLARASAAAQQIIDEHDEAIFSRPTSWTGDLTHGKDLLDTYHSARSLQGLCHEDALAIACFNSDASRAGVVAFIETKLGMRS